MLKVQKETRTLRKILNSSISNSTPKEDHHYAQNQLRKIYSQQFAKLLNQKKYEVITQNNKGRLDEQYNDSNMKKAASIGRMQERSSQRRNKLLKDRVQVYQNNDKKWAYKTEQIKRRFRTEEKEMLRTAQEYRHNWQKDIKKRQTDNKIRLKKMSQRSYSQIQSNASTSRQQFNKSPFNKAKLQELTRKRQQRFTSHKRSKTIDGDIETHRERQHFLTETKEKSNYKKLITKLQKMENIQQKRESRIKSESVERAKNKLYQKVYRSTKQDIGPLCPKHHTKQQNFRVKTINNAQSHSIFESRSHKNSLWQSNIQVGHLPHQTAQKKKEQEWLQYCRKTRRMKLNRLLKKNVRNVLQNQYKKDHFRTFILP